MGRDHSHQSETPSPGPAQGQEVSAQQGGVAIGGDVSHAVIVTGDRNVVNVEQVGADASPTQETRLAFEPELVRIPAGRFLFGSDLKRDPMALMRECPQRSVLLPAYMIARTPITNQQYAAFVDQAGYTGPRYWRGLEPREAEAEHPVVGVTWFDALAYCQWLASVTGRAYMLPSEAQWEKAARGSEGYLWPWGNERPSATRCNFVDAHQAGPTRAGQYSPQGDSPYGCSDMAGNVWEWTQSLFEAYSRQQDLESSVAVAIDCQVARVVRGGSYDNLEGLVRCAYREKLNPDDYDCNVGFRVVVASDEL